MLTPRIVRVLDLTEDDLRAFQMGRGGRHRRRPALRAPAGGRPTARCRAQPPPAPNPPRPGNPAVRLQPARPLMPPRPAASTCPAGTVPGRPTPPQLVSCGAATDRGACRRASRAHRHHRRATQLQLRRPRSRPRRSMASQSARRARWRTSTRRASRSSSLRVSTMSLFSGASGAPAALPSRCRMSHPPAELEYLDPRLRSIARHRRRREYASIVAPIARVGRRAVLH